jgi:uncharacterized SAM-binding protein YcdF (DUF218 family)
MTGQEIVWIVKALILPPGGILLLALLGLALGRRFAGKLFIVVALAGLYLLSTPFGAERLLAGLERYPALSTQDIRSSTAEAIVVLGGGRYPNAPEYGGDTVGGLQLERLRYAARLARQTGLPVIPSGGNAMREGPPEALLAKQALEQAFGVRVEAIEDKSRTTWENAYLTKELLDRLGIGKVLLVTHAWHMPRAVEIFRRADVDVIPAPTAFYHSDDLEQELTDWLPSAQSLLLSYFALHEYLGRVWYGMREAA